MTVTESMINSEPATKLPDGWRWVRLEDLFEVKQGAAMSPTRRQGIAPRSFLRTLNVLWGSVDLSNLDNMDFTENEVADLNLKNGDLLVCEGGDVGRTAIWRGERDSCLYQNHIHRLRRKNNNVSPEFYAYWMQAAFKVFQSYKGKEITTTIPNLSGGKLKSFLVPLPPNLAEQERIAGILNQQMAEVEKAHSVAETRLEAAKALPSAYLKAVFSGPKAQEWPTKPLKDICRDITDGTHVTPIYIPSGIPFLSVKDIKENAISFDDCRYISIEQHAEFCRRCKPEKGDVLYTKVGTTGIAKAIDIDREFSIFVSVALLKLNRDIIPEYLEKALNSSFCRAQAAYYTQGMANRNLVLQDLKLIRVPIPSILEQRREVAMLDGKLTIARGLCGYLQSELDAINSLPNSLLRQAFTGGL